MNEAIINTMYAIEGYLPLIIFSIIVLLGVASFWIGYSHSKVKVRSYIKDKFPDSTINYIKIAFLGPWVPGSSNFKFRVSLSTPDGKEKIVYAAASFFGSVYLREQD